MEITTDAIDGGALRRSTLTLVAARTQAAMPCASTYVGKSSAPTAPAPVMGLAPVCAGDLHRGWHEAQLVALGSGSTGAQHRHGRLVVDPTGQQTTKPFTKPSVKRFTQDMSVVDGIVTGAFDATFDFTIFNNDSIARSGPPCRPSV